MRARRVPRVPDAAEEVTGLDALAERGGTSVFGPTTPSTSSASSGVGASKTVFALGQSVAGIVPGAACA